MDPGSMKLYTSTGTLKTIELCNRYNVCLLMVANWVNPDKWLSFAVDNGCYAAYHRNEDWNAARFMGILARCKKENRNPDFIVIPDKPLSKDSLEFSSKWIPVLESMYPGFPRYLVVQDGMKWMDVLPYISRIQGIFIGGSMEWKMETMISWITHAHNWDLKCHVGRIGPVKRMMICELAGADSIDSTTWVQNKGGISRYVGGFKAQTRLEV